MHKCVSVLLLCVATIVYSVLLPHPRSHDASSNSVAVFWSAPFLSGGGLCDEAISMVQGLWRFGGGLKLAVGHSGDSYSEEWVVNGMQDAVRDLIMKLLRAGQSLVDYPTVIVCHSEPGAWNAPSPQWETPPALQCPHPGLQNVIRKVGRVMFETDRLPTGWARRLDYMDELWVPTHYMRSVCIQGGVPERKLVVIPEPVDTERFNPSTVTAIRPEVMLQHTVFDSLAGASTEAHPRKCRLLSVGKWEKRKGFDVLLRAFVSSFNSTSSAANVELTILSSSYHDDSSWEARIVQTIGTGALPRVRVLEHLPWSELPSLYAWATGFVIATRGEGWGRPIAEAMSMGKPVIATNFSGPTHFLTPQNSLPLAYTLVKRDDDGAFKDHLWAEPAMEELQKLLTRICSDEHVAELSLIGKTARATMEESYSLQRVAALVVNRVKEIANQGTK